MNNLTSVEGASAFLSDRDIAEYLSLTSSWVRKQRWLRRQNESHVLSIDPILIGSTPRYRISDFVEWLGNLENGGDRK